jgi:hypothetical protein
MKLKMTLLALAFGLLMACGGDKNEATPTDTPTSVATATPGPQVDGTVDPLGFGSTDPFHIKRNPDPPVQAQILLKDVRVGAHPEQGGWDRIVFEFASDNPQFPNARPEGDIEYVDGVSGCGTGEPIAVKGGAVLRVKFQGAQAHDEQGNVSIKGQQGNVPPRVTGPGKAIVEALETCDFEGEVTWGVGVVSKQRFKVTLLENPMRVVIDVKWP